MDGGTGRVEGGREGIKGEARRVKMRPPYFTWCITPSSALAPSPCLPPKPHPLKAPLPSSPPPWCSDFPGGDHSGAHGRALREEVSRKIEKWQEPPPARQPKPLPVPDAEPKKKRGGRRHRKMKER